MINSVKCLFWIMKNHSINWAFNIDRGFVNKAWLATLPRSILKAQSSVASRRPVQRDTGATFAPEWVHSGSLSWLYICLHDTTTKCYAGASHPGVSSPRLLYRGENFAPERKLATVSCKNKTNTRFGVKSVCRWTGTGSACVMFAILNHTYILLTWSVPSNNEIWNDPVIM